MGFAEALSDDGELTGRGHPWLRGGITGLMTMIGGIGHTLPYLVPETWSLALNLPGLSQITLNAFWIATALAALIVFVELWAIAWIRARYMDTRFLQAAFEVVLGGLIVFGPIGFIVGPMGGVIYSIIGLSISLWVVTGFIMWRRLRVSR